jgi:hypothetical protein
VHAPFWFPLCESLALYKVKFCTYVSLHLVERLVTYCLYSSSSKSKWQFTHVDKRLKSCFQHIHYHAPILGFHLMGQQFYHRNQKAVSDRQSSTITHNTVSYSIICLISLILHKAVSLWTHYFTVESSLLKSPTLMKYLSQKLYKYSSVWRRNQMCRCVNTVHFLCWVIF